ncbi:hypothetical protein GCM10027566_10910 [Arachidicoccus ginsenosidivorans]|uniref:Uncharacterized protein n=1 Tax=Arachidicoccus ginsenosidivorans TaxID=496057 RepID=A0A5B8VJX1_9BACT|nr:hypothetical protein [Arachidicoccus ginsenosidivorans]QEC71854.1 hypothetical protein FSB73_09440 [Arachidicoccus ginsenosidivorans]
MKMFDYVFYRVCKAYEKAKSKSAEMAAMAILSLTQASIILILIILFETAEKKKVIDKIEVVILYSVIIVLNYMRYIYNESFYSDISQKFRDEKSPFVKGLLVFIFIITILFLVIGLAIYSG